MLFRSQFDALVADEHGRAGDELAHLVLALAAERTIERVLGVAAADLAHTVASSSFQVRRRSGAARRAQGRSIAGPALRNRSVKATHPGDVAARPGRPIRPSEAR